jgi:uncharacterized membrane protein YjgN (DUF898 family)
MTPPMTLSADVTPTTQSPRFEFAGGVPTYVATRSRFDFDGGAATYVGTALLAVLVTVLTLGICYPFAVVLRQRWRAKHSMIDGRRLEFTGSAAGIFGRWLWWLFLIVVTLGIYSFWVVPRMEKWKWEKTTFA